LKIAIVDASEATRRMIGQLLKKRHPGIEISGFATAAEAFEGLAAEPHNLLTTALILPDMDGLEFARRVRAMPGYGWTPLIVVSGDTEVRRQEEGFTAGITAYFDKSEGLSTLVEFMQAYLARSDRPAGRVLYVEDSPTAAMAVRQMLELDNLDVVHLMSAEEAREILEKTGIEGPEGFDLLVSDNLLKGRMSGSDLVRYVRHALGYTAEDLPALLITVDGISDAEHAKLLACGANGVATKPLNSEEFVAQVNQLVRNRRRHEARSRSGQFQVQSA
jgi:two-component system cell cycle response regulator